MSIFLFRDGEKVDFQMAASAIDGATKIWGYKVDAMHREATQAVKGSLQISSSVFFDDLTFC